MKEVKNVIFLLANMMDSFRKRKKREIKYCKYFLVVLGKFYKTVEETILACINIRAQNHTSFSNF